MYDFKYITLILPGLIKKMIKKIRIIINQYPSKKKRFSEILTNETNSIFLLLIISFYELNAIVLFLTNFTKRMKWNILISNNIFTKRTKYNIAIDSIIFTKGTIFNISVSTNFKVKHVMKCIYIDIRINGTGYTHRYVLKAWLGIHVFTR